MGIVAKYRFNATIYADYMPEFNSDFYGYYVSSDVENDDGTITRTIECDTTPKTIMFGQLYNAENDNATPKSLSLLEVYEMDLSTVTSISVMFRKCENLTAIYCQFNCNFDIITSTLETFHDCVSLTSLNLSNFNTGKVTTMSGMFYNCSSLTSLDISNFSTEKVTNMNYMFYNCSSLISLDISNFDTNQVINMSYMFYYCSSLTSLNISNFKTENVKDMNNMFNNCSSLTSLDISNFDTNQVINMSYMFSKCSSLTSLDLSNFNTQDITNMSGMFDNCSSLIFLDFSSFNTENVTNMGWMFNNCSSLTSLDVSNFKTSQVTTMDGMFNNCSSLTSLDVSNFDTSKVTNMRSMFQYCSSLISLDVSNFNTSKVVSMGVMFSGCSSLTSLDLSSFNTENVTNMDGMFRYCSKPIDIGMIYCNSSTINKISNLITINTKIYYSLPDISELEPHDNIEYIKYIFPTKIQLPPHIQLYSLPDGTCDVLDVKTGILTRNVGYSLIVDYTNYLEYYNQIYTDVEYNDNYISNYILRFQSVGEKNYFALRGSENNLQNKDLLYKKIAKEPLYIYYELTTPIIEKLILNYNNSCNYGVILPKGTSDNYNVITNEYKQNLDFIPIDGSIAFDTATIKDTTVKYSVALSKFEVDTTNVRGSDGIYCDNDLFKYETSDNDYEHAYIENDTILHIYVNKNRLSSYDQVGFQMYLTNNPFDLYYAMRNTIISYVNYEDLSPEKASWEMLDCTEDGSITIESGNMDKTLLLDCLDYVAPTKNRFEIDLLKTNTQYTVYAEGVNGGIQLNFGGNIVNFTSGNIYTSGETQLVEFYTDNEIKNLIIIEGDTRNETIEFFEGLKSSENVTVISSNAPFVFGKGGKIQ